MKPWLPALLLTIAAARAEDPIIATPLPPIDVPTAPVQAPGPTAGWLPRSTALVGALDKVNARSTVLTIKVGQSARYGSLTVAVRGCVVRPPDVPADAAAFLAVTDGNPEVPQFSRWMLRSVPSVSIMVNPVYDLWIIGCSA